MSILKYYIITLAVINLILHILGIIMSEKAESRVTSFLLITLLFAPLLYYTVNSN